MDEKGELKFETPFSYFPIIFFWLASVCLLFFVIVISIDKEFDLNRILFFLLFQFLIYAFIGDRSKYFVYENAIVVHMPYRPMYRKETIMIKDIEKIVYSRESKGSDVFIFHMNWGETKNKPINSYFFADSRFDDLIDCFRKNNIPIYRKGLLGKLRHYGD